MLYNALVANSRKVIIEMQRYLPNTLSLVATFYIIFLAMFFGIRIIGDPASAEANIQFVIVSNSFWFLAVMALTSMGWEVTTEATRGTLEQLAMSPVGLPAILLLRMITNIAVQLVIIAAMLALVMWTAGQWLTLDLALVPILLPTIVSMIGVGYVVAGLSIIFKQIQALLQIMQFVFLGMTFVPLSALPWLELAPFVKGVDLTRRVMIQGLTIGDLGGLDWLSLLANAAGYFLLGLLFFRWCERVARQRGLLGQY